MTGRGQVRGPGASELICPACGARTGPQERFCNACRLPLVLDEPALLEGVSERHRRARMIKPQFTEGQPVKVAWVRNQAEGEFMQGLLLEQGVPSMLRRTAGFDVPDMLAAGPRDVIVPAAAVETAREVLLAAAVIEPGTPSRPVVQPARLLIGLLIALAIGALIIWLMYLALG